MGDHLGTPGAIDFLLQFFCMELVFFQEEMSCSNCKEKKVHLGHCQWPYHTESAGSHLNTKVKQCWAWLVLGWETTWELQVPLTFCFNFFAWNWCFFKKKCLVLTVRKKKCILDTVNGHTTLKALVPI